MSVAMVDPKDLGRLRKLLRGLRLPGQRELHLTKEKPVRRRQIIDHLVAADVQARIYSGACSEREQEAARSACLQRIIEDLTSTGAHRLVLDTRQDRDLLDEQTIRAALGPQPAKSQLAYEHIDSAHEPLIWIADIAGWAYGAGGDWRRRSEPLVSDVIDRSLK
jgi:hypothetical protein